MARIARSLTALMLIALLPIFLPAYGQEAPSCAETYDRAETAYFNAEFDRAIRLLRTCLGEADLSTEERVRFYRLLSFAHIAQSDREAARMAVERLLDADPDYTPDPALDRPDYVDLVREVKVTRSSAAASDDGGRRRWLRWVIGSVGAVALGVLAAVLVGGGSGSDDDDNDDYDDD